MKNFGLYKSKVEKLLVDSYSNGTIKENLSNFKKIILSDKNLKSVFYLYDELSSNKGMDSNTAKEYLEECISTYKNMRFNSKKVELLENWTKSVNVENQYSHIDNIFNSDILQIENRLSSKKLILETLIKKNNKKNIDTINIPLKSAISVANKTLSSFIETLNESEKKEFLEIAMMKDEQIVESYNDLKKSVLSKLENILESVEGVEIKNKINETINSVNSNIPDKQNLYKLKKLNESI